MKRLIVLILVMFFSFINYAQAEQSPAKATFAGGCFWCMESAFDKLPGVLETLSGYTGGRNKDPSYEQVSGGWTGHYEALQITYDPEKISYRQLLQVFWHNIDPTDDEGQFCDKGPQYRSAIFYHHDEQKRLALESKNNLQNSQKFPEPIKTAIKAAGPFYLAEPYHQNYYRKNPLSYQFYRYTCGRDRRLNELWGESNDIR
ncbi:peptide-methionine (S)-S-oxide reductase MsrA [Methylomarinum sp. Ch1-1]|uniref:Peptide methionine sulfoxide reductase MsrA n=1 Tax=Methylomarinum roseum TaxID=3067653 RepID=A0AAU7NSQ6_9GAMM|nr:peptide-methionine (S)-S-oxide reductase MsrA [Methylomarinum sp. Ch1-1]MDP4520336.1 peptide-methionine (S)-S-oxide reductase MsrA [Methylomarinum sp. Ch1-1]